MNNGIKECVLGMFENVYHLFSYVNDWQLSNYRTWNRIQWNYIYSSSILIEGVEWGWEREDPEGKLGKEITFEMQIHKISDQNKYIQKYTLNKWKIIENQKEKKKKKESKKNGETRYTHVLTLQMMLSVLFLLSTILVIVLCYGLFYIIIFLPRNSFFGVFSHELVDIIQRVLSVFITMTWFITISVLQPMSHMCERLLHLLPCVLNDPCISGMKQIFSWLKK